MDCMLKLKNVVGVFVLFVFCDSLSPTMQLLTSLAHKQLHYSKVAIYEGFSADQREPHFLSPVTWISSRKLTQC